MEAINENVPPSRPTGLKQPTRYNISSPPSKPSGLNELSESSTNARGTMGPPTGIPHKRKHTNQADDPVSKRPTLAEQAGQPLSQKLAAPPSSRPVNNAVRTATNGIPRNNFSSSTSRLPSNKTRQAPGTNYGASVGYGSRRPGTAIGHHRSASDRPVQRSATALSKRSERSVTPDDNFANEKVFDTDKRLASMELEFARFKENIQKNEFNEKYDWMKSRVNELEAIRTQLTSHNETQASKNTELESRLSAANVALEEARRRLDYELDEARRKHRNELEDLRDQHRRESDRSRKDFEEAAEKVRKDFETQIEKLLKLHQEELEELNKQFMTELDDERNERTQEVQQLQSQYASQIQNVGVDLDAKEREAQNIRAELAMIKSELEREKALRNGLQDRLTEAAANNVSLDGANKAMHAKLTYLESDNQAQTKEFENLTRRMDEAVKDAELANERLRQEETLRRKLHNQVQELKGNIRVMCRIRPTAETEIDPAKIAFPDADTDSKEVAVQGPETRSALGNVTTQTYSYSFDRVFDPSSQNAEVFEEIGQLVQSALDGYNVCIFCYGQTGSGKTYTMTSTDGMIPRAVQQIWSEATRLEEKGWKYRMEGSFVEVYNENLNDLLGKSEDLDKKKLEIRHDPAKKQTTIIDATTVELDGPSRVQEILERASKNRSVAATKANSRSSRSHSVFILKLVGENHITGERSEGTLNLVDLAGSERLEHSKAEGARLKETQNINKSLSCLGDVINALGSAKEGGHIPYRNSKLTYLLQFSLGGNSKTLMFVMVSPLQAHLQETITSLKFATKVHNTHIGTAKKQTKTRD